MNTKSVEKQVDIKFIAAQLKQLNKRIAAGEKFSEKDFAVFFLDMKDGIELHVSIEVRDEHIEQITKRPKSIEDLIESGSLEGWS